MKKPALSVRLACMAGLALASVTGLACAGNDEHKGDLQWVKHIVVVYMENHSFDNLYALGSRLMALR